jgi:tRNA dimethylallyltransferase
LPSGTGAPRPVVLVGPTASGKSALAFAVAKTLGDVEILSVDSMSVYRHMDIATAKPSAAERAAVPHHLIDLLDPAEECTVSFFQSEARAALAGVEARGNRALFVGGTGLYVRAVVDDLTPPGRFPAVAAELEAEAGRPGGVGALYERLRGLDPKAAERMTPTNRRRIVRALEVTLGSGRPFSSFGPGLEQYRPTRFLQVGIRFQAGEVDREIAARFGRWMEAGLLDEVRALLARPAGLSRTARQALGYRELLAHLESGQPLASAVEEAVQRTRSFARRQWAWFRRDPRITWIGPQDDPAAVLASALEDPERPGLGAQMRD